jgi:uncharacterized protein YjbJ (UPF0337 family)
VGILMKIRHKALTAMGAAKKRIGRATGNRRLGAAGRTDQAARRLGQVADKVRDAFRR